MMTIGPYQTLEILGEGGMAVVYKAQRTSATQPVAIKLMKETALSLSDLHARFLRETRILAKLNHPHIIRFIERGLHQDRPYLVTEYADQGDLRQYLNRHPITLIQRLDLVHQTLCGLESAHQIGIIHRDIKPGNILISSGDGAKLTDFGIATALWTDQTRLTQTSDTLGTLDYIAPEQRTSAKNIDFRADHYALGVILYELVTHHKPMGFFRPPSQIAPHISQDLNRLIITCLNPDPAERYTSTRQLKDDLNSIISLLKSSSPISLGSSNHVNLTDKPTLFSIDSILDQFNQLPLAQRISSRSQFVLKLKGLSTQAILLSLDKTDGIAKECLLDSLLERDDPLICPPMIALLDDPYYNEKASQVLAGQNCPDAEESLLAVLTSKRPHAHLAMKPLGHLKSKRAIKPTASFLKHDLAWIRALALETLADIPDNQSIKHIEEQSRKDSDPENRAKAQILLRRLKS